MPAKILVVDDEEHFEPLILQRFRRQIRDKAYEFIFARNGAEALNILAQREDIDVVLCDINMPKMDGLTFLSKLRDLIPASTSKTVMVSAYGDMKNIRAAMNLGAFDFVNKPIDFEDLEITINKTLTELNTLRKAEKARELEEKNEQLQELDELKSRFFTNISHELRTPLTIISGMAGQVAENPEKWFSRGLQMIRRNSDSLLVLVDQILDLRKLESGKLELRPVRSDVMHFLRYVAESFQSYAESKGIRLTFQSEIRELVMDYDPDRLLSVVSNLLSNAVKYTPEGGHIGFSVDRSGDLLNLRVKDSGAGIPEDQLPYIFDQFFQADPKDGIRRANSTGVGLALTRELVKLMDGDIRAENEEVGCSFYVTIPIRQSAPATEKDVLAQVADFIPGIAETTDSNPSATDGREEDAPTLLIVEDNPDVQQYLISCLEQDYRLLLAANGREGIEKALEDIPDIIVSDVMMPEKDGLELCEALKTDQRTSHIPIVLLTAKADVESRIAGLERGADAYLAKPFDKKELLTHLAKLLELRRQLQDRYSSLSGLGDNGPETAQYEDSFIIRVRSAVEAHLDDEDFATPQLCHAIGMSRSQLHKKIKALTGKSTTHFMRSIRLHKAKELLETTDLNISQVAYEVGFHDPKYFSKTFAEEFGLKPTEYRKS
ncbi:MAG: response regulator [Lewinellaceae bacterium]|nr:response regulator [Lewinellaceae bacterium]